MESQEPTPQNPQSEESPKQTNAQPKPRKKRRQTQGSKLDLLPPEIKADLDRCIAQGLGSKRCRNFMIERHGTQLKLVHAAVGTYDHYIELYEPRIREAARLDLELVSNAAQDLADLKSATTSQMPLDDQRKVFNLLFSRAEARIKKLELETASGGFDPRREALLNQHWKEERAILESYHAIQKEMQKQQPEELQKEFALYTSMLLHWVQVAYTKTHRDNLGTEFQANLSQVFKEGLDLWMAERKMPGYYVG
jgi:small-conductance mechanosensitive channel